MANPQILRERAAECVQLAVDGAAEETTAALIDLAEDYWASASYYERRFMRSIRLIEAEEGPAGAL